jgi:hypothetical protein
MRIWRGTLQSAAYRSIVFSRNPDEAPTANLSLLRTADFTSTFLSVSTAVFSDSVYIR